MSQKPIFEYDVRRGTITFFAFNEETIKMIEKMASFKDDTIASTPLTTESKDVELICPTTKIVNEESVTEELSVSETEESVTEELSVSETDNTIPFVEDVDTVQLASSAYEQKADVDVKNMVKKLETYASAETAYVEPPESHWVKLLPDILPNKNGKRSVRGVNGKIYYLNITGCLPDKVYDPPSPKTENFVPKTLEDKLEYATKRNHCP